MVIHFYLWFNIPKFMPEFCFMGGGGGGGYTWVLAFPNFMCLLISLFTEHVFRKHYWRCKMFAIHVNCFVRVIGANNRTASRACMLPLVRPRSAIVCLIVTVACLVLT